MLAIASDTNMSVRGYTCGFMGKMKIFKRLLILEFVSDLVQIQSFCKSLS